MKSSPIIGMAQMEIHPGEPARNGPQVLEMMVQAQRLNIDLLVFPEMCLPGYLLGDIWERQAFLRECEVWANRIIAATAGTGITVVFGTVVADWNAKGEDGRVRKFNAYIVAKDGRALSHAGLNRPYGIKTLLPNYREFDETRHFYDTRKLAQESGVTWQSLLEPMAIELGGVAYKVGILLCEDGWDEDYVQKPLDILKQKKSDLILNLSCSPFTQGKNEKRNRVFARRVKALGVPLFYVNGVSLQNNGKTLFTFDGRSTAYGTDGMIREEMSPFEPNLSAVKLDSLTQEKRNSVDASSAKMHELHQALRFGAMAFLTSIGQKKVVIGVSGGIDSAVAAALYAEFISPENLLLINMPSRFNSATTRNLAKVLAINIGCLYAEVPIEDSVALTQTQLDGLVVRSAQGAFQAKLVLEGLVLENIQARDRSSRILAAVAAAFGGVFTCNANKAEMTVGYSTLYGDLGGFLALLGDLWKGEVYALGRYLNAQVYGREVIPEGSFTVVPSAELSASQAVDEGKGDPLIYPYHDRLFFAWVQRWNRVTPEEILEWYAEGSLNKNLNCEDLDAYALFKDAGTFIRDLEKWWNLYTGMAVAKRVQAPPILAVSSRAFGFDHRESLGKPFYSTRYLEIKQQLLKSPETET